jgi:hypothetical protein
MAWFTRNENRLTAFISKTSLLVMRSLKSAILLENKVYWTGDIQLLDVETKHQSRRRTQWQEIE